MGYKRPAMKREKQAPSAPLLRRASVGSSVDKAVASVGVIDAWTALRQPAVATLRRMGIDDLLHDARLVREALRTLEMPHGRFLKMSASRRAELLWNHLFVERSALSLATGSVLGSLRGLGLTPRRGDLAKVRRWFASKKPEWLVDKVFEVAGIHSVVAVVDPFDETERRRWLRGLPIDPRFRNSLSVDTLLFDWPRASRLLEEWGYGVALDFGGDTLEEVRRFLAEWSERTAPVHLSATFPPTFRFPYSGPAALLLEQAVLVECGRLERPFAAAVGEIEAESPLLHHAGEAGRVANLEPLENLAGQFPEKSFLLAAAAIGNAEELTARASILPNLHPVGLGVGPEDSEATALFEQRLATLGATFTPFASRACVLDQLIPAWAAARGAVKTVLTEHYGRLADSGLGVTRLDVERDVGALLGGSFLRFTGARN